MKAPPPQFFMRVPEHIRKEVERINRGLSIEFDNRIHRWRVKHKDDRTGLVRDVMIVESKDGEYEDLNMGHVRWLREGILWDLISRYPNPKDLYQHIVAEHEKEKNAAYVRHRGYVMDFNRSHRREWKAALENARKGILGRPEQYEKKIILT